MKDKIDIMYVQHAALNYVEKLSELHDLIKEVAETHEESKQVVVDFLNQCLVEDLVSAKSLKITNFCSLDIIESINKCIFTVFTDSDESAYEVDYDELIFKDHVKEWIDRSLYLLRYK